MTRGGMGRIDWFSSSEPTLNGGWPRVDPARTMRGLQEFLLFVFVLEFIFSVLR